MHAADAPRREHRGACCARDRQRRGDRCRPVGPLGHGDGKIARRHLAHPVSLKNSLQLVVIDAEGTDPLHHGGDGGESAGPGDRGDHPLGRLAVHRNGEPLREHRAFQRNDRSAPRERVGDGGKNTKRGHC
jgi:hypothetical protein